MCVAPCVDVTPRRVRSYRMAVKIAHSVPGYERLSRKTLRGWRKTRVPKKKGRPVSQTFEQEVVNRLMGVIVDGSELAAGADLERIGMSNDTHSYEVIKRAANEIKAQPHWKDEKGVGNLRFSNKWVRGFLRRNVIRKYVHACRACARASAASSPCRALLWSLTGTPRSR